MYLLSKPTRVSVECPGAKCHPTLGDGSPDDPFIVGSESVGGMSGEIHISLSALK